MIIKDAGAAQRYRGTGPLLLLAGVVLGAILAGLLRSPERPAEPPAPPAAVTGPFTPAGQLPAAQNDLPVLRIQLAGEYAAALQASRERALRNQIISEADRQLVPATVSLDSQPVAAQVRLKGDWTDHVDTDKWSLRIELDSGSLLGMSRFSIQHPKTRGYLLDWLLFEAARREGLLAPRTAFVNVEINGRLSGVYFLEEHFTKEMLESQGRRDGPIVRFIEDTMWATWLQYGPMGELKPAVTDTVFTAEIGAYREGRLAKVDELNQRLLRALEQIREVQRLAISRMQQRSLAARQQQEQLQGATVDDLFVTEKVGRMLALYSLFRALHGLSYHQLRFYHDPVRDQLEPIAFDPGGTLVGDKTLVAFADAPIVSELVRSDRVYEEVFRTLGRMGDPSYVGELLAEVGPDLDRYGRAVMDESFDEQIDLRNAVSITLTEQAANIREIVLPRDPANFDTRVVSGEGEDNAGTVEVTAWATTEVPVLIEGFRFSNGRLVDAAQALGPEDQHYRRTGGGAVLPRDGRRLRFRFPLDERLASLRDIQAIKRAIREQTERDRSINVRVEVAFRSLATPATMREPLVIRRVEAVADAMAGRPPAPSLAAALGQHQFLAYDLQDDRLFLRAGTWPVREDLVVPRGYALHAGPGVTLRFAAGVALVSSGALYFSGTEAEPVVLEGAGEDPWAGMVVVDTPERSQLTGVVVRGAAAIDRGGWQTTGGVTFYGAPVDLRKSRIEDARGEDALNIVGTDFVLEEVVFSGGASDLFDGDFVQGTVTDCTFQNAAGDALDVSGANLTVTGCDFSAVGDKCLSAGEDSQVELADCTLRQTVLGVVAKDGSRVRVTGIVVGAVEHYDLAVFIKKPEYGPATLEVTGLTKQQGQPVFLVQEGCTLTVDGATIPGVPVDVEDLYRRKILGK